MNGFELDNQRIARAQVQATLELVKAVRDLIEVMKRRNVPEHIGTIE